MDGIDITLTVSEESLEKILSIVSKYININNISLKHYGHENAYKNVQENTFIESIDKQNVENNVKSKDADKTIDMLSVENNDKSIDLNVKENTLVHSTEECSIVHSDKCSTVQSDKEKIIIINNNASGVSSNEYIVPDINEVGKYIRDTGSSVSPSKFYKYYEERDWRDGSGERITDWKEKVDAWTLRERKTYTKAPVKVRRPFEPTEF